VVNGGLRWTVVNLKVNLVAWQLESGGGRESKEGGAVARPVSARSGRQQCCKVNKATLTKQKNRIKLKHKLINNNNK
jgi:hypothetical protein